MTQYHINICDTGFLLKLTADIIIQVVLLLTWNKIIRIFRRKRMNNKEQKLNLPINSRAGTKYKIFGNSSRQNHDMDKTGKLEVNNRITTTKLFTELKKVSPTKKK